MLQRPRQSSNRKESKIIECVYPKVQALQLLGSLVAQTFVADARIVTPGGAPGATVQKLGRVGDPLGDSPD
jgi:hypothetical protein